MTETLMTVLCLEHQGIDVTELASRKESSYDVLIGHGGKLISSVGAPFDIFLFDSPTEAVLGGTEILERAPARTGEQVRIIVHTGEVMTNSSALEQLLLDVVAEMLSRARWGDLVLSDSTYGSIKISEIGQIDDVSSWLLKTDQRRHQMYRVKVKADAISSDSDRKQQDAEILAFRRGAKNAPYDRRALCFLVDYFLAVLSLSFVGVVNMIPEVWDVYSSRNVFEFENFDLENVRTDFSWKAYGGEMVVVGYQGRLRKRAYFKKGLYNVDVVFTDGSRETDFEIKIGEFKTNVTIGSESANYQLFQSKLRLAENLDLDGDTDISFELVTDTVGLIALDSLIVVPVGHEYHERSPGAMFVTNRYEDVARLLNLWVTYNKDGKYLFLFLIRCYPVWMLLNILFLSFCTWTPGALIFRLRIITLKGERPGFNGAVMRVFAAFAGLFAFGYGGFQPLISHDERTWSDTWSRTRLVILE